MTALYTPTKPATYTPFVPGTFTPSPSTVPIGTTVSGATIYTGGGVSYSTPPVSAPTPTPTPAPVISKPPIPGTATPVSRDIMTPVTQRDLQPSTAVAVTRTVYTPTAQEELYTPRPEPGERVSTWGEAKGVMTGHGIKGSAYESLLRRQETYGKYQPQLRGTQFERQAQLMRQADIEHANILLWKERMDYGEKLVHTGIDVGLSGIVSAPFLGFSATGAGKIIGPTSRVGAIGQKTAVIGMQSTYAGSTALGVAAEGPGFLTKPEVIAVAPLMILPGIKRPVSKKPVVVEQLTIAKVKSEPVRLESGAKEYAVTALTKQKYVEGRPGRPVEVSAIVKGKATELARPEMTVADIPTGAKPTGLVPEQIIFKKPKEAVVVVPSTLKGKFEKMPVKVEQMGDVKVIAGVKETQLKDFFDIRQRGYGARYKQEVLKPVKEPGVTKGLEPHVKFDQFEIRPFVRKTPVVKEGRKVISPEGKGFGEALTEFRGEDFAVTKAKARYQRDGRDVIVKTTQYTQFERPPSMPKFEIPKVSVTRLPKGLSPARPPGVSKMTLAIPKTAMRQPREVPVIGPVMDVLPATKMATAPRTALFDVKQKQQPLMRAEQQIEKVQTRASKSIKSSAIARTQVEKMKDKMAPVTVPRSDVIPAEMQRPARAVVPMQGMALGTAEIQRQKTRTAVPTTAISIAPVAIPKERKRLPPPFIPEFKLKMDTGKMGKQFSIPKGKYKPSATAFVLDFKAPKEPKIVTGYGIRPITPKSTPWLEAFRPRSKKKGFSNIL